MDKQIEDAVERCEFHIKWSENRLAIYGERRLVAQPEMWSTLDSLIAQETAAIQQYQAKIKALRDGTYTMVVWRGPGWYLPVQTRGITIFYYRDYPKYVVPNEPGMGTPSWFDAEPDWATEIQDYRDMRA